MDLASLPGGAHGDSATAEGIQVDEDVRGFVYSLCFGFTYQ